MFISFLDVSCVFSVHFWRLDSLQILSLMFIITYSKRATYNGSEISETKHKHGWKRNKYCFYFDLFPPNRLSKNHKIWSTNNLQTKMFLILLICSFILYIGVSSTRVRRHYIMLYCYVLNAVISYWNHWVIEMSTASYVKNTL